MSQVRLTAMSRAIDAFDARDRVIAVSRSLLAAAQVSILLFTPTAFLFVPVGTGQAEPQCGTTNQWTAHCLVDGSSPAAVNAALLIGLSVVLSGYFPRWTGLLHVWITYSISTSLTLPDGGEVAAQIFVVFFALILLSDDRKNHWFTSDPAAPKSRMTPLSWAGLWGLRFQVFWIYVTASTAKFGVEEWSDGSALYYITRQVFFGVDGPLESIVLWATEVPFIELALTWGALILELSIAVLILSKWRRYAAFACAAFHLGIVLVIGLWSFGIVMIAGVLAASMVSKRPQGTAPVRGLHSAMQHDGQREPSAQEG